MGQVGDWMKHLMEILQALLLFVLGFLILFSDSIIMNSLKTVFITFFLISGLISLLNFIITKDYKNNQYINLIVGTINVWSSLFIVNNYELFLKVLPQIISVFAVIIGITFLIDYLNKENKTKLDLIKILLLVIYSLFLIGQPLELATIYTKLSGLGFIVLSLYILGKTVLEKQNQKEQKTNRK